MVYRLVYVKRITACAREVGIDETITHISPLLKKLAADGEAVIRQALGQELGLLATYCADPAEVTTSPCSPLDQPCLVMCYLLMRRPLI
jgi:hypothetical protein